MKAYFPSGLLVCLLLISGGVLSDSLTDVLTTDDWSAEAAEARRFGTPIMILFTDEDCGYCERLKTEVLEPLVKHGELSSFARILELDIDRGGKIRDFDGEKIRTRVFVKRYDIYATPTLMLVDYQGKTLGTPIVGFNDQENYISYLEYFMGVAYWEPQQIELPCEERLASDSLDNDHLENATYVTQISDFHRNP